MDDRALLLGVGLRREDDVACSRSPSVRSSRARRPCSRALERPLPRRAGRADRAEVRLAAGPPAAGTARSAPRRRARRRSRCASRPALSISRRPGPRSAARRPRAGRGRCSPPGFPAGPRRRCRASESAAARSSSARARRSPSAPAVRRSPHSDHELLAGLLDQAFGGWRAAPPDPRPSARSSSHAVAAHALAQAQVEDRRVRDRLAVEHEHGVGELEVADTVACRRGLAERAVQLQRQRAAGARVEVRRAERPSRIRRASRKPSSLVAPPAGERGRVRAPRGAGRRRPPPARAPRRPGAARRRRAAAAR